MVAKKQVCHYYYYYYYYYYAKTTAATTSYSVFIVLRKETAFPAAELLTGVETERLFLWCPG